MKETPEGTADIISLKGVRDALERPELPKAIRVEPAKCFSTELLEDHDHFYMVQMPNGAPLFNVLIHGERVIIFDPKTDHYLELEMHGIKNFHHFQEDGLFLPQPMLGGARLFCEVRAGKFQLIFQKSIRENDRSSPDAVMVKEDHLPGDWNSYWHDIGELRQERLETGWEEQIGDVEIITHGRQFGITSPEEPIAVDDKGHAYIYEPLAKDLLKLPGFKIPEKIVAEQFTLLNEGFQYDKEEDASSITFPVFSDLESFISSQERDRGKRTFTLICNHRNKQTYVEYQGKREQVAPGMIIDYLLRTIY